MGSPGFIPPERRAGLPPTPRADLWQVGVLAGQMLLGRTLQSPAEVPDPPRLHPALGRALRQLLAADPRDRPSTATDVAQALGAAAAQVKPQRAIALDLEGTLIITAHRPEPRHGLADFAGWCLDTFDRIFIYTAVEDRLARALLSTLRRNALLPVAFHEACELVEWPHGAKGTLKDLRRLGLPLEWVVLLDDMPAWVPEDQRHRFVPITPFDSLRHGDDALERIRPELLARFEESEGAIRSIRARSRRIDPAGETGR